MPGNGCTWNRTDGFVVHPGAMGPKFFQRIRAIRWLNEIGFALTLATAVGVAFEHIADLELSIASFAATLVLGPFWAIFLRKYPIAFSTSHARGRLIAIGMAIANAALAGSFMLGMNKNGSFIIGTKENTEIVSHMFIGAFFGATFGALFWIPTLFVTIWLFALPTAWASALAKRGLAGEERGEWLVGAMCAATSVATYVATFVLDDRHYVYREGGATYLSMYRLAAVASFLFASVAAFAAWKRDMLRKVFVANAKEGNVPGYRVQDSPRGEILVRVAEAASAYRAMETFDEVFAVDEEKPLGQGTERGAARG